MSETTYKSILSWAKESDAETLRKIIVDLSGHFAETAHAPRPFVPGTSHVPVAGKVIGRPEMEALVHSCLDFWLTTGRFNTSFEAKMKEYLNRRFFLTCNSGSSANLLAVSALCSPLTKDHMKPGDEVITCATGFPTTINPLMQNGLVPVFVDVDLPTYNILPERIEAAITDKTRAIVVAHTLGNPFDLGTVMDVAKRHNLFVVEDTCDALGATYDDQLVGTFGDIGTISFYPAHHITMGEGGGVFTDNGQLKRVLESIRDWGRDCWCEPGMDNTCNRRFSWKRGDLPQGYDHKYTYSNIGYNLKISDMQAAVGDAQVARIDDFVAARRTNFDLMKARFAEFSEFFILPEATPRSNPSWFGFPVTVRDNAPFGRDDLVLHLNDKNVGTRLLFGGNIICQPYMKDKNYRVFGDLTNSNTVMTSTFWLGVFPGLTGEHYDYMFDEIRHFISRC